MILNKEDIQKNIFALILMSNYKSVFYRKSSPKNKLRLKSCTKRIIQFHKCWLLSWGIVEFVLDPVHKNPPNFSSFPKILALFSQD